MQFVPPIPSTLDQDISKIFLDAIPTTIEVQANVETRAYSIQLTLSVPEIERFARNPNMAAVVAAVEEAIKSRKHRLRFSIISDDQIESEFERLQGDGSIRDLMPGEGEW